MCCKMTPCPLGLLLQGPPPESLPSLEPLTQAHARGSLLLPLAGFFLLLLPF